MNKPITRLLQKGVPFEWSAKQQIALDKIKTDISKQEALGPFETSSTRKVVFKCDACKDGMGTVIEQEQPNGQRPVLYWSSQFRAYEQNYSISEKEALACVTAVTRLRKYLLGCRFILQTDNRPLKTLLSQTKARRTIARIERWCEKLSCFDYEVEYLKGEDNFMTDWFSRSPKGVDHEETHLKEEIVINAINTKADRHYTYSDEFSELAYAVREDQWPADVRLRWPSFFKRANRLTEHNGLRFVLDPSQRSLVIETAHKGHQGIRKTQARLKEQFWWPTGGSKLSKL